MEKYNETRSNVEQNLFGVLASSGSDGGSDDSKPVASEFTGIGGGTPLLADAVIDGGADDPQPVASEFTSIGNGTPLLADAVIDGGSDNPKPVASEFTSIGNGTPLLADAIIDGGSSGGDDDASPERRTSRGVVAGNSGNGLTFSDGIGDGFGELLPSGLISDTGDEAFFKAGHNKSVSNASGNLVVPDSGTDPFAAPLATLI